MTQIARSLDKLHRNNIVEMRKSNMFYASPADIEEEEGFNPRNYENEATKEHIRTLADAYKAGAFVEPIVVQVKDGKIFVRDGHCRRRGMHLAIAEGADLGQQPMIEFKGDENEADALILTSQSGKRLTAIEVGMMYHRMMNRGKTVSEVAKSVGKTQQHVHNMLGVHSMPVEIKDLIEREVVSATLALKTYNEKGTAAVKVLRHGVEEVLKSGKDKLTEARLAKASGGKSQAAPRIGRKVVEQMTSHFRSLTERLEASELREDGTALLELNKEEVEALKLLRSELPEVSAPAAVTEPETEEATA